jgi:hypothetical protein
MPGGRHDPVESSPAPTSLICSQLPGAYFCDCWAIPAADAGLDALSQFLRVAQTTPAWIDALMQMRNRVVSVLGLKDLGAVSHTDPSKPSTAYRPGDRIGIFTLISASPTEALLGDQDKHLDVVVSIHTATQAHDAGSALVTVTTVVHVHNWLGKLYMVPVRPAHRVIVKTLVRAIGHAA